MCDHGYPPIFDSLAFNITVLLFIIGFGCYMMYDVYLMWKKHEDNHKKYGGDNE